VCCGAEKPALVPGYPFMAAFEVRRATQNAIQTFDQSRKPSLTFGILDIEAVDEPM
jgi:hypothetical protein